MYWCYHKCLQAHKVLKYYLRICSTYTAMAEFHTEFKGDAIMLGNLGSCKNRDLGLCFY